MGAGFHGGFGNGTRGAKDNATASLISEMEKAGVKFNKEDVVFATKDGTGQTVWLEKGNSSAGLEHIVERHERDYANVYGIKRENIPKYVKSVIDNGKILHQETVIRNGRPGIERIYEYNNQYYTLLALGTNGFIVAMYPLGRK